DGERLSRRPEEERAAVRARTIGLLFQQENLVGHLTVGQNVRVASAFARTGNVKTPEALLDRVGLAGKAGRLPHQLSGGEQARAGLAVAIANDPRVLLADEPTGELDEVTSTRVLDLVRARADGGAAVVVVTHDPAVARLAD